MLSGLLGSVAPCVLYGSNVERLAAGQSTFANSCFTYTGLYMLGSSLFGWNCLAPWFSHPTRTAIRQRYNLEASVFGLASQLLYDSPLIICNWNLYIAVLLTESSNFTVAWVGLDSWLYRLSVLYLYLYLGLILALSQIICWHDSLNILLCAG